MSADDEIQELERRIRLGDESAQVEYVAASIRHSSPVGRLFLAILQCGNRSKLYRDLGIVASKGDRIPLDMTFDHRSIDGVEYSLLPNTAERMWFIRHLDRATLDRGFVQGEAGFWNNQLGWVTRRSERTIFTQSERDTFNLPIGGIWVMDTQVHRSHNRRPHRLICHCPVCEAEIPFGRMHQHALVHLRWLFPKSKSLSGLKWRQEFKRFIR